MTLIITEKGTQASALASIMERSKEEKHGLKSGVYEGIEFLICPLSGHILETDKTGVNLYNFTPPRKILPRIPDESSDFKKRIHSRIKFVKDHFFSDIDSIILATDPDPEGCSIAKEMMDFYNFDVISDVTYMDISNTSEKALKKALNKALTTKKDHLDWERMAFAAMLKSDFSLTGYAVTYTMNDLMKKRKINAFFTFGTQQIRILDLVVKRYREHKEFDRSNHYRLKVHTNKGVFVFDDDGDTKDKDRVEKIAQGLKGERLEIIAAEKTKDFERSPKWYDGSQIGSKVSKQTKISIGEIFSNKTSIMQTMYERGLITYIRGEAKGKMPMVDFSLYAEIAKSIASAYGADKVDTSLVKPYLWRKEDSKEKVNHTPCTLADSLDVNKYKGAERAVLDVAAKQILATFYPDAEILKYAIDGRIGDYSFRLEDKKTISLGWKEIYGEKPHRLSNDRIEEIEKGDTLNVDEVEIEEYQKTPPPLFTEATLMDAIKKKGIGSESTFGELINFILDKQKDKHGKPLIRKYCEVNKKKQIIPTEKGMMFVDAFPEKLKNSLKIFENGIFKLYIAGEIDEEEALKHKNKISSFLYNETVRCFEDQIDNFANFGTSYTPKSEKVSIDTKIKCPMCQEHTIIEKNHLFQCGGGKTVKKGNEFITEGCQFSLFKESKKGYRYTLTQEILEKLIDNNVASIEAYNIKHNRTQEVRLKLSDDLRTTEIIHL